MQIPLRASRIVLAALAVVGILHGAAAQQGDLLQARPDYQIGIGDVLSISVWKEPQLTRTVTVRPDGKVTLPLIPDVTVAGLTAEDAQTIIHDQLTPYFKHPQVSVTVAEVHSKLVYVTGEVQRPGAYNLLSPTTVVQLIARAGGVTDFAKTKKVYVLHASSGIRVPVNYKAVLQGRRVEDNIVLATGDTVVVP
ncbi:MAG TPA: polysaccharide biosynthesis/export family protein [Acidisarcina sp.]